MENVQSHLSLEAKTFPATLQPSAFGNSILRYGGDTSPLLEGIGVAGTTGPPYPHYCKGLRSALGKCIPYRVSFWNFIIWGGAGWGDTKDRVVLVLISF